MSKFLETAQMHPIWPGYVVDDADDDTVATGDYVSLKNYGHVAIHIAFGDGGATTGDISIEVYQATDVSGSDVKALKALVTGRIYSKTNASTLAAVGQWTAETQATASEIYTDDTSGEKVGELVLEIDASDLDVTNGFDCIRADLGTITSAKLVYGQYILTAPKVGCDPTLMPSALAD